MSDTHVEHVKALIASFIASALPSSAVMACELSDRTDLREEGILDSLGFVQLIAELERHLGERIDLAGLEAESLTNVGALTRHIANTTRMP
jgi:acyl carrier protein